MIFLERPNSFDPKISVVACYLLYNGKFVLLQRQPHKTHGSKWDLPAGKIDDGEDDYTAIIREVFEETGITLTELPLKKVSPLWVEHDGHQMEYQSFITELTEPVTVTLSNSEHQSYRWVTPRQSLSMELVHDLKECTTLFFDL